MRAEADRELAPYRRKMPAAQIDQLQKQYIHKTIAGEVRTAAIEFVLHVTETDRSWGGHSARRFDLIGRTTVVLRPESPKA